MKIFVKFSLIFALQENNKHFRFDSTQETFQILLLKHFYMYEMILLHGYSALFIVPATTSVNFALILLRTLRNHPFNRLFCIFHIG